MKSAAWAGRAGVAILALVLLLKAGIGQAQQNNSGNVRGTVTDPSGAAVVGAKVTVTASGGETTDTTTNALGAYEVRGLAPGSYQVTATAPGFQISANAAVTVAAGQTKGVDIGLQIAVQKQEVQVQSESSSLDVGPENNAGAVVLKGSDLDALSDDPDELQADLQALAGPSIGPNGGQMYIDGFTAGQLPPKSSIREVRINSNPFSAEYDRLGFGRIEIITKAGGGTTHGSFFVMGNSKGLNTGIPKQYVKATVPGYYTLQYNGNLSGSLGKNTSYFMSAQQRRINESELGALYDPLTFTAVQSGISVANPRTTTQISPQIAYNLSKNNTLTFRYSYERNHQENSGVGQYSTPDQAFSTNSYEHSVQISDTQVFGATMVMDTRFQFNGEHAGTTPVSTAPVISVPSYVTLGGASQGVNSSTTQSYELQNYFTLTRGKHALRFGVRWRDGQNDLTQISNSHGTFQFLNPGAFQAAETALANNQPIDPSDYPNTFSIAAGQAFASVNLLDAGAFIQDDYRWRPNVTLSGGLRFESQTDSPDHMDWGPRVAVAWGIGRTRQGSPNFVVRGGWGIFYDRFSEGNALTIVRQNGVNLVTYSVNNPNFFPNIPTLSSLQVSPNSVPTLYQIGSNFHAPYTMESAATLEHQLSRTVTMTMNYVNARGVKQLYTANINAPTAASNYTVRPNPGLGNVNQFTPGGVFRQNQLSMSFVIRATGRLTLNASYTLNYANATANTVMFANDPGFDYGPAGFDVRHRVFASGNITLPYGFSVSPFVTVNSGAPYNLTSSSDWTGNFLSNRPAFTSQAPNPPATNTDPPQTIYAFPGHALNLRNGAPQAGETIVPVNYLRGPGNISANLRVAKSFSFGKPREVASNPTPGGGPGGFGGPGGGEGPGGGGRGGPGGGGFGGGGGRGPGGGGFGGGGGGRGGPGGGGFGGGAAGGRRYTVTLSANARNLFNHVNPGTPVGTLGSPNFLKSTSLGGGFGATTTYNRQISLQATFSF